MPFSAAASVTTALVAAAIIGAGCGGSADPRPPEPTATQPSLAAAPSTTAEPSAPPPASAVTVAEPADASLLESNPVPVDSSLQLPPIVDAEVEGAAPRPTVAQVRAALDSRWLALAPKPRKLIQRGRVSGPTLELLRAAAGPGSQLLVHAVSARQVRIQATSLADTRALVTALRAMTAPAVKVELRPVRPDFADAVQPRSVARASDVARRVVAAALAQVGQPYSWGAGSADGPTRGTCDGYHGSVRPCPAARTFGFDCSGLTLYAYAQAGITLDHYAAFQWLEGRRIAVQNLMPGDLVFFNPKADGPGHVGLYVGHGAFVQAPRTGDVVKVSPLASYARSYMGAVRPA